MPESAAMPSGLWRETKARRVVRTTVRRVGSVLTIHLADAKTGREVEAITATGNHPFYVAGVGFVEAERLGIGCQIVTRAGPALVVQSIDWQTRPEGYLVYNFEVADDHTYFVGRTDGGIWVHNPGGPCSTPVVAGEAGSYGELNARSVVGDQLTPHHIPQDRLGFTSRNEGGAIMLPFAEHTQTYTYGRFATEDVGLSFRKVLAKGIVDVRRIAGSKYNSGLLDLINYYKENFPGLIAK